MGYRAMSFRAALLGLASALSLAAATMPADAADKELKIGFVGVTSGPAAAWGTSNVRSMQTRAAWLNEIGGVKIGGDTYKITVITFDDQKGRGSTTWLVRTSTTARPRFVRSRKRTVSSISLTPSRRNSIPNRPRMLCSG